MVGEVIGLKEAVKRVKEKVERVAKEDNLSSDPLESPNPFKLKAVVDGMKNLRNIIIIVDTEIVSQHIEIHLDKGLIRGYWDGIEKTALISEGATDKLWEHYADYFRGILNL